MNKLRGSMVALVTPFDGGKLDEAALRKLVRFQLQGGTDALVPCGTTGEAATLSPAEYEVVVGICVEEARSHAAGGARVPVIAGTTSNATSITIENTRRAKAVGADCALVANPYYNKPSQEGLYRHFSAVAEQGGLPVVLYNVPGRSAVDLLPETVGRLAKVAGVVAIKEASGNVVRVAEIREKAGDELAILAGDDMFTLATLAMGGDGVISVVGNLAPRELAGLCDSFFAGDLKSAQRAMIRFSPLVRALFLESNPMPVKYAAARMGLMKNELRLPLCPVLPETEVKIDAALRAWGLVQ